MSIAAENIRLVKDAINALNTGDTTKVSEFISPTYFNHESQMDPVRSKMRGPQEVYRYCDQYTEGIFGPTL